MCDVCGCGDPKIVSVEAHENLLGDNDRVAAHTRDHLRRAGTLAINLMGSPGSGKTALLEATARALGDGARLAALNGDLATDNDARRLRAAGIRAQSITTGSACHLDAEMVHRALHRGASERGPVRGHGESDSEYENEYANEYAKDGGVLFIENVGNLVCPAIYDLGQAANVVALAVTEGEDKPLKYPVMFRKADLVVLTKIDLLPALPDFDRAALEEALARVMPVPRLMALSARTGEGVAEWASWLAELRARA